MNARHILISLIFGFTTIFYIRYGDFTSALTKEDGIIEYLSALFYLVGFFAGLISIHKNGHILFTLLWTALCLIFLGEETSWFQRLLHYSVPFIERQNAQNEFNIHNLNIFNNTSLTLALAESDYIAFIKALLSPRSLFQIGFFCYFSVIPVFSHNKTINKSLSSLGYKKPDTGFIIAIIAVIFTCYSMSFNTPPDVEHGLSETREMLYAYFIMTYILCYIWPSETNQFSG